MPRLPRPWRLWSEPVPQSRWARSLSVRVVRYLEGIPGARVVVWTAPGQWTGTYSHTPLPEWRRWWIWAEEVER